MVVIISVRPIPEAVFSSSFTEARGSKHPGSIIRKITQPVNDIPGILERSSRFVRCDPYSVSNYLRG